MPDVIDTVLLILKARTEAPLSVVQRYKNYENPDTQPGYQITSYCTLSDGPLTRALSLINNLNNDIIMQELAKLLTNIEHAVQARTALEKIQVEQCYEIVDLIALRKELKTAEGRQALASRIHDWMRTNHAAVVTALPGRHESIVGFVNGAMVIIHGAPKEVIKRRCIIRFNDEITDAVIRQAAQNRRPLHGQFMTEWS